MACNGRQFNSIEEAVCQLVYVERAEVIKSEEVNTSLLLCSSQYYPTFSLFLKLQCVCHLYLVTCLQTMIFGHNKLQYKFSIFYY